MPPTPHLLDVLGCQWNDVEAPRGIRLRVSLKSMLAVNKIMQKLGKFFSLSLSLIKLSVLKQSQSRYFKTFNSIRHFSMSVSNNLILRVGEMVV
jgi:hypothetical protein